MSIPGHHHKVVFIGDVREIDTDGSGAVIGVILMLDADEPCDVSIMFPAARPGVLIGNRLGVRGRLAYEPMPHRRESLHVVRARGVYLVKRPRQASSQRAHHTPLLSSAGGALRCHLEIS
jgi:hypothetical protein